MSFNRQDHWENIYSTKEVYECSWYQKTPTTAIGYIERANLSLDSEIIDVGGGDGFLVDYLLEKGYSNITVLDISETAINKAKQRLGEKAKDVTWIVSDIVKFKTDKRFDFWFDRAVFHFLTDEKDIEVYVEKASSFTSEKAHVVIGTFSIAGPTKCSGIEIKQYDEKSLSKVFQKFFKCSEAKNIEHPTPFNSTQDFIFCSFRKL